MKEAGLVCKTKRRFKITTDSNHLKRQFIVNQINWVYTGDVTYIHTQEGWLYLAVVIDFFPVRSLADQWLRL